MKDKKKIVIGILCTLVAIMTVGYALLAQELNINGRASIDSTWKVEITNITEKDIVGDATSKETPSYTSTTANFSVGLIQPGDSITYDIEISNLGTLKAKVDSINVTMDTNDAITYTTSGVKQGDKLGVGEKAILTVKVEYSPEVTSQPTNIGKDITVIINYIQDLGNDAVTYDTYSIGDVVTFAGSNWYVIKNSNFEEDYVTLMKEKVLTNAELGDYAYHDNYDTMAYYYSDTCHYPNSNGYTDYNMSECNGHNDYEGSKIRELLEGTYINALGETNLKEVNGYKIRLITLEELQNNLGCSKEFIDYRYDCSLSNTPSWVYQNFGEKQNNVLGYWTMTSIADSPTAVFEVQENFIQALTIDAKGGSGEAVRPVINLLKSSI